MIFQKALKPIQKNKSKNTDTFFPKETQKKFIIRHFEKYRGVWIFKTGRLYLLKFNLFLRKIDGKQCSRNTE